MDAPPKADMLITLAWHSMIEAVRKMPGLFITGTDTGVGKTVLLRLVASLFGGRLDAVARVPSIADVSHLGAVDLCINALDALDLAGDQPVAHVVEAAAAVLGGKRVRCIFNNPEIVLPRDLLNRRHIRRETGRVHRQDRLDQAPTH